MSASRPLFLASQSPRRAELLTNWGVPFQVIPNCLDHEVLPRSGGLRPLAARLKRLALLKATCSAADYKGIILSADTIVVCRRQVLGKPRDLKEAAFMLSCLSGRWHRVMTSVCLLDTQTHLSKVFCSSTAVLFHSLTTSQIEDYISNSPVLDKAGSYAIQDLGSQFVQAIQGLVSTVVGLPEYPLKNYLKQWGVLTT